MIYSLISRSSEIRTQHLHASLAVWKYAFASARFLFRPRRRASLEETLLGLLQRSPAGLTRTEISDKLHHHERAEDISAALDSLRERGLVSAKKKSTGGRSAERWFVTDSGRIRNV